MSDIKNIIVIGASAGGITALRKIVAGLSSEMDIAVLAVLHVSPDSNCDIIAATLQKETTLRCVVPTDDTLISKGCFYLAPANRQMMAKDNLLRITHGTEENKYRPSIDVLFRSAAVVFSNRVIGVILTGMLEDGTSGMWAVKRCGGICIVQRPGEAEFSDMPNSVMNKIKVDYIDDLHQIPKTIEDILNKPLPPEVAIPKELMIEAKITENMMSDIQQLKKIGDQSDFVCPDCGGGLWEIKNDPTHRYRCYTGHVYTENLLQKIQNGKIDESIWVSIRMLEEKVNLLSLMSNRDENNEDRKVRYENRVGELNSHIERLKNLLSDVASTLNKGA
jgi:two-component system chemotaxis response regulator CheB